MTELRALAPLLELGEPPFPTPVVSDAEVGAARGYVEASRAASTRRAYDGDWSRFSHAGDAHGRERGFRRLCQSGGPRERDRPGSCRFPREFQYMVLGWARAHQS